MATTAAEPTLDALSLSPLEHELLEAELADFAAVLPDPAARARYAELAAAVQQGEIPASLVAPLETMLDLVLQTQRVRRRHGAEADTALQDLLARTPRGRALRRGAHDVNKSLSALSGHFPGTETGAVASRRGENPGTSDRIRTRTVRLPDRRTTTRLPVGQPIAERSRLGRLAATNSPHFCKTPHAESHSVRVGDEGGELEWYPCRPR